MTAQIPSLAALSAISFPFIPTWLGIQHRLTCLPISVEMETINPVEGYCRSEYPAICNNFGVTADRNRKALKIFEKILRFWKNEPLR